MQVQHDAGTCPPCGGERAPAQAGQEVVRVHDARPGAPYRLPHLFGRQPTAQQARCRPRAPEHGGVSLEQLGLLTESLAHQP